MLDLVNQFAEQIGVDGRYLVIGGLAMGTLLLLAAFLVPNRRPAMAGAGQGAAPQGINIFVDPEKMPAGLSKAFLPTDKRERNAVRRNLEHAGFTGPNAVLVYYGLRVAFGLLLPAALAALLLFRDVLPVPPSVSGRLSGIGGAQLLMVFGVLILVGFYGPAVWLRARAADRADRVEKAFPNALDLLQVSVEAGLGFDAALTRVAEELADASPEINKEFTVAQQEILAGRNREDAYRAMADRLAIEEAYAFVNVVLQSMRFGTSMSQALLAYSADMRQRREIRAQERANKLPVYMSATMAGLMMPALLIVTIGPVVLRYINTF